MWPVSGEEFAGLVARRVDQVITALDEPTPQAIEAVAAFAEREAGLDDDVVRAAMGRAFAAELRRRAEQARTRST
jgi:hypothetical protein